MTALPSKIASRMSETVLPRSELSPITTPSQFTRWRARDRRLSAEKMNDQCASISMKCEVMMLIKLLIQISINFHNRENKTKQI